MHPREKQRLALRRKYHIRRKISGTEERPRISVFRSHNHFYAQVIDDSKMTTLFAASSVALHLPKTMNKATQVAKVAEDLITKWKKTNYQAFVFDRNGYLYHGHVKAFAEQLRKAGMKF